MNQFAGMISDNPNAGGAAFLNELRRRFPARLTDEPTISDGSLQALGPFLPSLLNESVSRSRLYLDGEIFNAVEIAQSFQASAEAAAHIPTLLHALILEKGIEALSIVNGQFLIILWDEAQAVFHLLNDQAGIQQLFYYQGKDYFLFASDIKFLFTHPQCPHSIDWEGALRRPFPHNVLNSYRAYHTWFKEIHLLPEASVCKVSTEGRHSWGKPYWNGLDHYLTEDASDRRKAADVMEEYWSLLDDAVKIRTAGSGTACSFLSGGLDSSAICALAARNGPLHTFSIVTQNTVLEDTTSICHQLGKDLGFENSQFLIPYHELAFDKELWKQRIWRTESPVNHVDALTKNLLHYGISQTFPDIPYVLTGTGSDQLNGGLVRWVINDSEHENGAEAFLEKVKESELSGFIPRDSDGLWRMRGLVHRDVLASMAGKNAQPNYWMYYVRSALHIETYSLLWDELRAGSAHGRSVRFPFLDHRFIPFIAAIPARLHAELFFDKQILRRPAEHLLPRYVSQKAKAPTFIPEYDFRFRLFDFLTSGPDSLLEQAFGDRSNEHPVINMDNLRKRMEVMKRDPEIYEWQELIDIINFGLLEQLAGKSESDLNFEKKLEVPVVVSFDDPAATKEKLRDRLAVRSETEMLDMPLRFFKNCALLRDEHSGATFLAKNNRLMYELDDEQPAWGALLKSIDGKTSTRNILARTGHDFEAIREFFLLAVKEQLLAFDTAIIPQNDSPWLA